MRLILPAMGCLIFVSIGVFGCAKKESATPATETSTQTSATDSELSLSNFQSAAAVFGQASYGTSALRTTSSKSIDHPASVPTLSGNTLYVPDPIDHRVLGFDSVPLSIDPQANFVVGQVDLSSESSGLSNSELDQPTSIQFGGGKMFLADKVNYRILIWNSVSTGVSSANIVVGQPDADSKATTCDSSHLNSPQDFKVVGSKLIVADTQNHRVLIWNTIPTSTGQPAQVVLGQSGMTSCSSGSGTSGMNTPTGIYSDGTRLYVADSQNHRVLGWNSIPTSSGATPNFVLGQTSLANNSSSAGNTGLNTPVGLCGGGNRLFVVDQGNNRVLGWNGFPTSTAAGASIVIGQSNFTMATANDPDQDGVEETPSAFTLKGPSGCAASSDYLVVTDTQNNRFLVWQGE